MKAETDNRYGPKDVKGEIARIKELCLEGKTPSEIAGMLKRELDIQITRQTVSYWKKQLGYNTNPALLVEWLKFLMEFFQNNAEVLQEGIAELDNQDSETFGEIAQLVGKHIDTVEGV